MQLRLLNVGFVVAPCAAPSCSPCASLPAAAWEDEPSPPGACPDDAPGSLGVCLSHIGARVADLDTKAHTARDAALSSALSALLAARLVPAVAAAVAALPPAAQLPRFVRSAHARRCAPPLPPAGAELSVAVSALDAVAAVLRSGGGPFLLGAKPCSADASLLACLSLIADKAGGSSGERFDALRAAVAKQPSLGSYLSSAVPGPLVDGFRSAEGRPKAARRPKPPGSDSPQPPKTVVARIVGGMSERRKTQLAVAAALGSLVVYSVATNLPDDWMDGFEEEENDDEEAE